MSCHLLTIPVHIACQNIMFSIYYVQYTGKLIYSTISQKEERRPLRKLLHNFLYGEKGEL